MKRSIAKRLWEKVLSINKSAYAEFCMKDRGYLYNCGWYRSYKEGKCVDLEGNPIPWITYPAMSFINGKVKKEMEVFEYGSGYSTLWWASKTKKVYSVEHEKKWFEIVKSFMPENVELFNIDLEQGGYYSCKIREFSRKFDIVVIDGRDRKNCSYNSINALKEDGIIIFDNSDRNEYKEGYEFLNSNNFKRIDFWGIGPLSPYSYCTSVFYRKNNCFGI